MNRVIAVLAMTLALSGIALAQPGVGDSPVGVLDTIRPTLESISVPSYAEIEVTFSKAMLSPGATTPENYTLSGPGMGMLTSHPDSVVEAGAGAYALVWDAGTMIEGAEVTVTVSNVQDALGNPIALDANSASGIGVGAGPTFSALVVEPAQAMPGDRVTVSFTSSVVLDGLPTVWINRNPATFVSETNGTHFVFEYEVLASDETGPALIEISGYDLEGFPGELSNNVVFRIGAAVPLNLWLLSISLLAIALVTLRSCRRSRATAVTALFLALAFVAPMAVAQEPVVSNVEFAQKDNGAGTTEVVITYDLATSVTCDITVSLSMDAGEDGFIHPVTTIEGDVAGVTAGTNKQIVWSISEDYPEAYIPEAQIRVTAVETETIMLPGDVPLTIVRIPAGSFMRGRNPDEQGSYSYEDPQHEVTLSSAYWMGKYPVTKAQWEALMGTAPWAGRRYVLDDPDSPATHISWNDAQDFITALNNHAGGGFRLPTEAEWEYAAKAGTTTRFYWGDHPDLALIDDHAWWKGNTSDEGFRYAPPVGEKRPNPWGLYDMAGNIWEWCNDRFGPYPNESAVDPTGPTSGTNRVIRGGSWFSVSSYSRSALRGRIPANYRYDDQGFRVAR